MIWKTPARMTARSTAAGLPVMPATMPAMTTVIGPVGPEIWVGVPPKIAATMPMAIAP